MTKHNALLLLIVVAIAVLLFSPALAHAADAPKAPPPKLYIYPKLLPPQKGEVIIRDPSRPEVDTSKWA